jgi:hypothetical protein
MTITQVQFGAWGGVAGETRTKSFTNTPTAGNLLIAWATGETVASNVSIPGFTLVVSELAGSTASGAIFYKIAGAAESKDVVITWTGSTQTNICIAEYSGIVAAAPDKTANADNDSTSATAQTSGTTDTTSVAEELAVALFQTRAAVTSQSYSNGFTEVSSSSGLNFSAYKVLSATGAQETTMSWTTSVNSGGCIATFYATPSGSIIPVLMNQFRQRKA